MSSKLNISGRRSVSAVYRPAQRAQPQRNRHKLQNLTVRQKSYRWTLRSAMVCATADDQSLPSDVSRVIICGGGVIGTAVSYYLAKRGVKSTVVDRCGLAAAASGRAGGFLALDWNDASRLGPLARLSYQLHAGLEEELGMALDYRQMDTFVVQALGKGGLLHSNKGHKHLPDWVNGHVTLASRLGDTSTTAQVHPRKLTEAFMEKAGALAGSNFVCGTIEGIFTAPLQAIPPDGADTEAATSAVDQQASRAATVPRAVGNTSTAGKVVSRVRIDGQEHEADVVVVALGPWSNLAAAWLPLPMAVSGQKYHSAVLAPSDPESVTATALFTNVRAEAGGPHQEPEIYPRPDGTVYVCGEPSQPALPASAADVHVHDDAIDRIVSNCAITAPCLGTAEVQARQACFLPLTADGLPMIGAVRGVQGGYVATGHSCWGILNGPATGLALSELIVDGEVKCVDISPYNPDRFED